MINRFKKIKYTNIKLPDFDANNLSKDFKISKEELFIPDDPDSDSISEAKFENFISESDTNIAFSVGFFLNFKLKKQNTTLDFPKIDNDFVNKIPIKDELFQAKDLVFLICNITKEEFLKSVMSNIQVVYDMTSNEFKIKPNKITDAQILSSITNSTFKIKLKDTQENDILNTLKFVSESSVEKINEYLKYSYEFIIENSVKKLVIGFRDTSALKIKEKDTSGNNITVFPLLNDRYKIEISDKYFSCFCNEVDDNLQISSDDFSKLDTVNIVLKMPKDKLNSIELNYRNSLINLHDVGGNIYFASNHIVPNPKIYSSFLKMPFISNYFPDSVYSQISRSDFPYGEGTKEAQKLINEAIIKIDKKLLNNNVNNNDSDSTLAVNQPLTATLSESVGSNYIFNPAYGLHQYIVIDLFDLYKEIITNMINIEAFDFDENA